MRYEKEKTRAISFPLGGIGTGCVGLAGNGELIDWEIFNRPNKKSRNGYSHFALRAETPEGTAVRVLQGDTGEDPMGNRFGFGPRSESLAGLPHFRETAFEGDFPLAGLSLADPNFPLTARLTAFNPVIPHNERDSMFPAAFFEWEIANPTGREITALLAFTVRNPAERSENRAFTTGNGLRGVFLRDAGKTPEEIGYAELCMLCDALEVSAQENWYRGDWRDGVTTYWNQMRSCRELPARAYAEPGKFDHATLAARFVLPAGERKKVRFILAWSAPTRCNDWSPWQDEAGRDITWRNRYAVLWKDARAAAEEGVARFGELLDKTRAFADAVWKSDLPLCVRDAAMSSLAVLRSPTVLCMEDGTLWGWEGVREKEGICEGSCQHVWNYAYALPFLYPRLERSLREATMKYALQENGMTDFRIPLPFGRPPQHFRACLDGQMGEVFKCYREWVFSGDTGWLRDHADAIFRMLDYAFSPANADAWDADGDGVLEGRQHHTLDMELFGPSSWLEGLYLLALQCGVRMAEALGQTDRAATYRKRFESGRVWMNENLFNGSYFCQKIDLNDRSLVERFGAQEYYCNHETGELKYQIGEGCEIDQMLADWHAALIGAAPVFDAGKKQTALDSMMRYNFQPTMRGMANLWRNFAMNDEAGTIICAYPEGARKPAIPIPYCEETMTGFEYAFAGLLAANGKTREAETVVKAVRDRYDGAKRNPWNEIECGSNYARSMAAFALLPIWAGQASDMTRASLSFAPRANGTFFWTAGGTWGTLRFGERSAELTVLGDPLTLNAFSVPVTDPASVLADGAAVSFRKGGRPGELAFAGPVQIAKTLTVSA